MKLIYALCGLLLANAAWAVPDLVVDSVRMPAWVERGAQHQPLAVGMELRSGDVLVTGAGSRALLKAADGSDVRLGANVRCALSDVGQQHDAQPQFDATLAVQQGALRLSTAQRGKLRARTITLKVAGVAATTNGGDIWARSEGDGNGMVLLLSGAASVAHGTDVPLVLDQPLSSVVMSKDAAPLPMSGIGQKRLDKLLQETAIAGVPGTVRTGGRWKVNLMELDGEAATLAAYDGLREAGYDVRILPRSGTKYRLRIIQLPNRAAADALATELRGKMGITSPSVSR